MQFKNLLYWTAVLGAIGQIIVALYSRYFGELAELFQTAELPSSQNLTVIHALNYMLPVGVGCLALLFYTRKINEVNGVALLVALGLQFVAMEVNLRAAKHVFGEEITLASITWWAPK